MADSSSDPARALPAHGTRARYYHRSKPCRCELCRRGNRAYIAGWRGSRPPAGPAAPVQLGFGDVAGHEPLRIGRR